MNPLYIAKMSISIQDVYTAVKDGNNTWIYRQMSSNKIDVYEVLPNDPNKNTLLHLAVIFRNINLIRKLIDEDVDPKIKNAKGDTVCDLLSYSGLGSMIERIIRVNEVNYDQLDSLRESNESKTVRIHTLETENNSLKTSKTLHLKKISDLETETQSLKDKIQELSDNIVVLSDKKRRREQDSSELQMVKRRNIELEETNCKLEEENARLKKSVSNLVMGSRK